MVYLNDIIAMLPGVPSHFQRFEHVFQKLQEATLKVKFGKCSFLKTQIDCLGHTVDEHDIHTNARRVQAKLDWSAPTCVDRVKSFLGMAD